MPSPEQPNLAQEIAYLSHLERTHPHCPNWKLIAETALKFPFDEGKELCETFMEKLRSTIHPLSNYRKVVPVLREYQQSNPDLAGWIADVIEEAMYGAGYIMGVVQEETYEGNRQLCISYQHPDKKVVRYIDNNKRRDGYTAVDGEWVVARYDKPIRLGPTLHVVTFQSTE